MRDGFDVVSDGASDVPCLFAPEWGEKSRVLWQLIAAVQAGELLPTIESLLSGIPATGAGQDVLSLGFSLALLRDILRAGGTVFVRDSRLFVSWPDWSGDTGRQAARQAMALAREMRPLSKAEVHHVAPLFTPDIDGHEFAKVLSEAEFRLRPITEQHPSGISYQSAFAAALRYWTMPYRGRSGRMRRFVLTAEHASLGHWPIIAGILELGDEAPFCTWRDDLLGLSPSSFAAWIQDEDLKGRARLIRERLHGIRRCLRPTSTGWDLATISAEEVVQQRYAIERASEGRSRVLHDQKEILKDRKRLAYGLRLARGEVALANVAAGRKLDSRDPDIVAGVRALHDLILPRLHLEATVCGAIPPFSQALGGKLMVAFLGHPLIISAPLEAEGELLGWSFYSERLLEELPKSGMLCLTTKGLYANHAAIYNRGETPGLSKPVRMFHLDNTDGNTTSLVSTYTTRFARQLLERGDGASVHVSSVYGSGGAKRHRAIEKATVMVGLPKRLAMAGIPRPVYGMKFARNPAAVSWLREDPDWLVDRSETGIDFSRRATVLWRQRWLAKAIDRIRDYAIVPSLTRMLLEGRGEE